MNTELEYVFLKNVLAAPLLRGVSNKEVPGLGAVFPTGKTVIIDIAVVFLAGWHAVLAEPDDVARDKDEFLRRVDLIDRIEVCLELRQEVIGSLVA